MIRKNIFCTSLRGEIREVGNIGGIELIVEDAMSPDDSSMPLTHPMCRRAGLFLYQKLEFQQILMDLGVKGYLLKNIGAIFGEK